MVNVFEFTWIDILLLATSLLLLSIQTFYSFYLYFRIHLHQSAVAKNKISYLSEEEWPPISVVICACNESENLKRSLPVILEQNYPNFEVIVVNDGSTDESEEVLSVLEEKHRHLYHTFTPEGVRYLSRKKLALTVGIKASKHNWLVFTEANCCPASPNWLRMMARNFVPGTEIVLGYSGYEKTSGWWNRKISYDNLFTSMRFLGFALMGKTYMGRGRNMAYRKDVFFEKKGYSSHLNLQRGDDDLFINEIATPTNTRVETAPEAIVRMDGFDQYRVWKEDKVSYSATSRFFRGRQIYLLGWETMSRLLFYVTIIASIVFFAINQQGVGMGIALLLAIVRYTFQAIVVNKTAADLNERRFYLTLPLFNLLGPFDSLRFKLYRLARGKGDFMRR